MENYDLFFRRQLSERHVSIKVTDLRYLWVCSWQFKKQIGEFRFLLVPSTIYKNQKCYLTAIELSIYTFINHYCSCSFKVERIILLGRKFNCKLNQYKPSYWVTSYCSERNTELTLFRQNSGAKIFIKPLKILTATVILYENKCIFQ